MTAGDFTLRRTEDGYLEVDPKPTPDELRDYYRDRYFANPERRSPYSYEYTADELRHKQVTVDEILHVVGAGGSQPRRAYEVGAGEGFTLAGLAAHGWDVAGVDFTSDGVEAHNPSLGDRIAVGDVFDELDRLVAAGERFDLLICNNVLEHVIDPVALVASLRRVVADGGWVRIMVPNDDSVLQREVVAMGHAEPQFWVAHPDHLSYFSPASLVRLLERCGWTVGDLLADYPIDTFLLNPATNYVRDPTLGRSCHFARVAFELALAADGIGPLVEYRRGCARAGVGRNLIAYAQPAHDR
jgi:2-polyprenyl-3-methyl-5-hydroxy-6-metoxy-1,4-benzoquinol methylase